MSKWFFRAVVLMLLAATAWCTWQLWHAVGIGKAMARALDKGQLRRGVADDAAWKQWRAAAEAMQQGRFERAAERLSEHADLARAERAAAERFFAQSPPLKQRFVAVAQGAEQAAAAGLAVEAVRQSLLEVLLAAARRDTAAVVAQLDRAEQALDDAALGPQTAAATADKAALAAVVSALAPAYELGQRLLTEGHAAVDRLLDRSSREAAQGEWSTAYTTAALAASLAGVDAWPASADERMPEWFLALATSAAAPPAAPSPAERQVGLAEAMAAAEQPSAAVRALVAKARRRLDAGDRADALWWAETALAAMGVVAETPDASGPSGTGEDAP